MISGRFAHSVHDRFSNAFLRNTGAEDLIDSFFIELSQAEKERTRGFFSISFKIDDPCPPSLRAQTARFALHSFRDRFRRSFIENHVR